MTRALLRHPVNALTSYAFLALRWPDTERSSQTGGEAVPVGVGVRV